MGLSVDLELASDNIEMNSNHKAFLVPIDRMDDKKTSMAGVAVELIASTPTDAKHKSDPIESPNLHMVSSLSPSLANFGNSNKM